MSLATLINVSCQFRVLGPKGTGYRLQWQLVPAYTSFRPRFLPFHSTFIFGCFSLLSFIFFHIACAFLSAICWLIKWRLRVSTSRQGGWGWVCSGVRVSPGWPWPGCILKPSVAIEFYMLLIDVVMQWNSIYSAPVNSNSYWFSRLPLPHPLSTLWRGIDAQAHLNSECGRGGEGRVHTGRSGGHWVEYFLAN